MGKQNVCKLIKLNWYDELKIKLITPQWKVWWSQLTVCLLIFDLYRIVVLSSYNILALPKKREIV